jgi:hypothetical protein
MNENGGGQSVEPESQILSHSLMILIRLPLNRGTETVREGEKVGNIIVVTPFGEGLGLKCAFLLIKNT